MQDEDEKFIIKFQIHPTLILTVGLKWPREVVPLGVLQRSTKKGGFSGRILES